MHVVPIRKVAPRAASGLCAVSEAATNAIIRMAGVTTPQIRGRRVVDEGSVCLLPLRVQRMTMPIKPVTVPRIR